jgi:Domain of unknown function (DUF4870)
MDTINIEAVDKDQRTWAMIAHLSGFAMYMSGIGLILGPLIVWLLKRDGNPFVDDQGKEALNFSISGDLRDHDHRLGGRHSDVYCAADAAHHFHGHRRDQSQ